MHRPSVANFIKCAFPSARRECVSYRFMGVSGVLIGKCRMCLQERVLVKSHLMPAALYDYCRKGEHRPIKVGGGFVIPTDRQTQDYLLCEDCEDVLNTGGER